MTTSNVLSGLWLASAQETEYGCKEIVGKAVISVEVKIKPLHPNISIHIPHTLLFTFTKVLTRRIGLTIHSLFSWLSFP